uniref:Uncharacterized protein n=1 Tax=Theileria annulata TaxID=5874 RepID=A0A3B0MZV4_THEAN
MISYLSSLKINKILCSNSFVYYFNFLKRNNLSYFPVSHYRTLSLKSIQSFSTINSIKLLNSIQSINIAGCINHTFRIPNVVLSSGIANTKLTTNVREISTLKRRKFKIKKHKKKKRKKRWSRMSLIPWRPTPELKHIHRSPSKVRRIVKERRRRNKGNRTLRIPRQR